MQNNPNLKRLTKYQAHSPRKMSLKLATVALLGILLVVKGGYSNTMDHNEVLRILPYSNSILSHHEASTCPCEEELLCMSLEEARRRNASAPHVQEFVRKLQKKEVFAFVLRCDASTWLKFDWTKLTTIALSGFYDPHLLCHAHKQGVRVVKLDNIPTNQLPDASARQKWVELQVSDATLKFLDGINLDFEADIDPYTPEERGLTSLVRETADTFHKTLPGSQVSFDVAWSAQGIDGRFYDYKAIAAASDLIFIMAYDEQSQIFGDLCTARPNSGIYKTAQGLLTYLSLGIPAAKMVLGVPWYGYNYSCIALDKDNETCHIRKVPFMGVNCSDAAGRQFPFSWIAANRLAHNATYHWDDNTLTPWYNYKGSDGMTHQTRYDDPSSLTYKYMLAVTSGLRGVGMWTANFLDYSTTDPHTALTTRLMWSLLP